MSVITRFYTYLLEGDKDVAKLSVTIGNGQAAVTSLYLEGKPFKKDIKDTFADIEISENDASLSGKLLDISTTIFEVNPDNTEVSFRLKLTGGPTQFHPAADKLKVSQGGTAYFIIKVIFI